MPSYKFETQRDIVITCMTLHNFLQRHNLSDRDFLEVADETYIQNTEIDDCIDNRNVGSL